MKDLTKGNELKLLFAFTMPLLLGNVCQQLYNTVDSIVVGNYVGEGALTAVGISFPITFLILSLVSGVTMGNSILISQFFGAKMMDKVKLAISTTLKFMVIASVIATIVALSASTFILKLMHVPEEIFSDADLYLKIFFCGLLFNFGYNAVSAICRGLGDSRTPLILIMVAAFINVILDILFVAVFGWGIAGVAIATIISQFISFIVGMWYLKHKFDLIDFNVLNWKLDKSIFKTSLKIGLPIGIQQTLISLGNMTVMGIVNSYGLLASTTFSVSARIDTFAIMPAISMCQATASFVGQNIAIGEHKRIKKGILASLLIDFGFAAFITLAVLIFGTKLMGLFGVGDEVLQSGMVYFYIVAPFYIVFAIMQTFSGLAQGAGHTMLSMVASLVSLWVVRVPVAKFMSNYLSSVVGVWWGIAIGWVAGAVVVLIYYFSGKWKKAITHHQNYK